MRCFQYKDDAERFYAALIKRLAKFDLQIAEEKTKILEFGRFAEENRKRKGLRKPKTVEDTRSVPVSAWTLSTVEKLSNNKNRRHA